MLKCVFVASVTPKKTVISVRLVNPRLKLPMLNDCVCCWKGVSLQETDSAAQTYRGATTLCCAALCWKCLWRSFLHLWLVGATAGLQMHCPLWPHSDQGHPFHPHPEVHLHTGEGHNAKMQLRWKNCPWVSWCVCVSVCVSVRVSVCVSVCQEAAAVTSSTPSVHQSESDIQLRQQEELTSVQQQFQQLCSDVDQLAADMKHMCVTHTQVTHTHTHTHKLFYSI